MEKIYQPQDIESHWYQTWEENGYFKPSGHGSPYCITIPPPNVTGSLHLLCVIGIHQQQQVEIAVANMTDDWCHDTARHNILLRL